MRKIILPALLFLFICSSAFAEKLYDPVAVWLTLDRSPTSAVTIRWLVDNKEKSNKLQYREKGDAVWQTCSYQTLSPPYPIPYNTHLQTLSGLKSGTEYEFRFGPGSVSYFFQTAPETLKGPFSFISGGDIYHDDKETLIQMHRHIPELSPNFIALGGDIAYSAPKFSFLRDDFSRWLDFLVLAKKYFRTKDGKLIPIAAGIGNHEVIGRYHQSLENAPFYSLFFLPPSGTTNYHLLFGDYLSFTILDSGHTQYVSGRQNKWLENTLKNNRQIPHRFALYHVPAWPSVRKMQTKISPSIRMYWVPLFEKYSLNIAFEHHDHAYKRTYPIKNEQIDPEGVVYIGDGGWGVKSLREPKTNEERWFIEKKAAIQHFLFVTIEQDERTVRAITPDGKTYDTLRQPVKKTALIPIP